MTPLIEHSPELVTDSPVLYYRTHFPYDPEPEETVFRVRLAILYSRLSKPQDLAEFPMEEACERAGMSLPELDILVMDTLERMYYMLLDLEQVRV